MDTSRTLLRSSRVRLAAISDDDLPMIASWWSDADFARPASDDPVLPQRVDELKDWFLSKDRWRITTAIRLNESDALIGFLKLTVTSWPHRCADISLGIGEPGHRRQGYGTEAMRLGIDCAFRELNMHRLQLTVFSYNTLAIRMYERLGFTHEGTLRESLRRDGIWYDTLLFGLISGEA